MRLSGDAWLCEGNNEITSDTIVYDIAAERVLADAGEDGDGRVRIVITPQQDEAGGPGQCGDPPPFPSRGRVVEPPAKGAGENGQTPASRTPDEPPTDAAGPMPVEEDAGASALPGGDAGQ